MSIDTEWANAQRNVDRVIAWSYITAMAHVYDMEPVEYLERTAREAIGALAAWIEQVFIPVIDAFASVADALAEAMRSLVDGDGR